MKFLTVTLILISVLGFILSQKPKETRYLFTAISNGPSSPSNLVNNTDLIGNKWNADNSLTGVGQRMNFLQGIKFRQKYSSFISKTYKYNEVYARSADFNSSITAVQAFMNGLYYDSTQSSQGQQLTEKQRNNGLPPFNDKVNFSGYDINSVDALPSKTDLYPVHLMPEIERQFNFFYGNKLCTPLFDQFLSNLDIDTVKNFMETFNSTYFVKLSNVNSKFTFINFNDTSVFLDTFRKGYLEGMNFTSFENAAINLESFNQVASQSESIRNYQYLNGGDKFYLPQVTFSPFYDMLKIWVNKRIEYDSKGLDYNGFDSPKLTIFSVERTTIASFFIFLKQIFGLTSDLPQIDYASTFNLELRTNDTTTKDQYEILLSINDKSYDPININDFFKKIDEKIMDIIAIEDYCSGLYWLVGLAFRRATIGLGVLFVFFFFLWLLTIIICCCCYERKRKTDLHQTVPVETKL